MVLAKDKKKNLQLCDAKYDEEKNQETDSCQTGHFKQEQGCLNALVVVELVA